ncbi:MAG TPA: DUF4340 domain-containing protein [Burkholderiales bacterium]|nr:DUF4340 domain-containing protein [Burkholderiales bacterium]
MNRKHFLYLVVVLVVLGAAGFALFWQDIAAYRASGAKIGAKLLPGLKIADVAEIRLQSPKHQVTLARKEKLWVVQERGGYPASFGEISDLMIKLVELKVTQSEQVGASLLPRVELADPGAGEGGGTLIEFRDGAGKVLAGLILGKTVLKKDPLNPLPAAKDGVPAGRYVRIVGAKDTVVVVSDPLGKAEADPGKWLNKDFFKAERIRTLAAGPEGAAPHWKIARAEEWGPWKFAAGGGELNPSAAVSATNKLGALSFDDVAPDAAKEAGGKPYLLVAETFDNLVYTVKVVRKGKSDEHYVSFTVRGEPPKSRVPEKGEKPQDKERRDKEFAESRKKLEERIAAEQALSKWTYVIGGRELEPLLKTRGDMEASRREQARR